MVPNVKISFLILNERGTRSLVCIAHILVEANLEVGVTSLIKRILGACNWKLTICGGGYTMSDVEELLQVLILLLTMTGIIATGPGQELLPMNCFHAMRITIIGREGSVYLIKVWVMML